MLFRETFAAGPFSCNCSILACTATKKAIVIDPGGETARIAELLAHHDLSVEAIVHTHAHLDHIYCTSEVKEAHGGQICLHKEDLFLYDGIAVQAAMFGWQVKATIAVERFVEHGDRVVFGEAELEVIHTPGHTPGSVCYEVTDEGKTTLFAGDTLFRRSVGRTDLLGGDSKALASSIRTRLYSREPDSLVITGHGPTTILGDEALHNPFVRK